MKTCRQRGPLPDNFIVINVKLVIEILEEAVFALNKKLNYLPKEIRKVDPWWKAAQ